jgi:hypothetical protein
MGADGKGAASGRARAPARPCHLARASLPRAPPFFPRLPSVWSLNAARGSASLCGSDLRTDGLCCYSRGKGGMERATRDASLRVLEATREAMQEALSQEFRAIEGKYRDGTAELQQSLSEARRDADCQRRAASDAKTREDHLAKRVSAQEETMLSLKTRIKALEQETAEIKRTRDGAYQRTADLETILSQKRIANVALQADVMKGEQRLRSIASVLKGVQMQYRYCGREKLIPVEWLLQICSRAQSIMDGKMDYMAEHEPSTGVASRAAFEDVPPLKTCRSLAHAQDEDVGEAAPGGDNFEASQALLCDKALPFRPAIHGAGSMRAPPILQEGKDDRREERAKERAGSGVSAKKKGAKSKGRTLNGGVGSKLSLKSRPNSSCSPPAAHSCSSISPGSVLSQSSSSSGGGGARLVAAAGPVELAGAHKWSSCRGGGMEREGSSQMLGDMPDQLQVPMRAKLDDVGLDHKSVKSRSSAHKVGFIDQPQDMTRHAGDASASAFSISQSAEERGGKASAASGLSDPGGAHIAKLDDSGNIKDALDSTIDGDGADDDVLDDITQEDIIEVSRRSTRLVRCRDVYLLVRREMIRHLR